MIVKPHKYRAAWVPEDLDNSTEGDARAIARVDDEAGQLGVRPILVLNSLNDYAFDGPIAEFAQRSRKSTTKSTPVESGSAPVLAYAPDAKALDHAIKKTKDQPLCVVEGTLPVRGWASATGAINLTTNAVTPPPEPELAKLLDRLAFNANNAFGDDFGRKQARNILDDLSGHERADYPYLAGYLLARGRSVRAIENLARIANYTG